MLKNILIFTAGAIVGALAMHLYVVNAQNEYELTPEEQEELDDCKATMDAIINKTNYERPTNDGVLNTYTNNISAYAGVERESHSMRSTLTDLSDKGRETMTDIYQIDDALYTTTCEDYDKLSLEFYSKDKVIRDMSSPDDAIYDPEDVIEMVGEEEKDYLYNLTPELSPQLIYIRNERLKIDYEIEIIDDQFYDEEEGDVNGL